jgi:hypothetical protein
MQGVFRGALSNEINVVRSLLINIVVYPILEKEIGMGSPSHDRSLIRIVIEIVILRELYIITLAYIASVFLIKRVRCILQVTSHKELSASAGYHHTYATLLTFCQNGKIFTRIDVFTANLRMTAVRHIEEIIEATENRQLGL